jgi:hypothetical protein
MNSSRAISPLAGPRPTNLSTSSSRGVSEGSGAQGEAGARAESRQHPLGDRQVKVGAALGDGLDRFDQPGAGSVLEQEPARPGTQRGRQDLVLVEGGQHRHRPAWIACTQPPDGLCVAVGLSSAGR